MRRSPRSSSSTESTCGSSVFSLEADQHGRTTAARERTGHEGQDLVSRASPEYDAARRTPCNHAAANSEVSNALNRDGDRPQRRLQGLRRFVVRRCRWSPTKALGNQAFCKSYLGRQLPPDFREKCWVNSPYRNRGLATNLRQRMSADDWGASGLRPAILSRARLQLPGRRLDACEAFILSQNRSSGTSRARSKCPHKAT